MISDFNIRSEPDPQTADNDSRVLIDLVRTLENAYGNAIKHATANSDSEATDLLLENASIRLSFRILLAITADSCPSGEPQPTGAAACPLDDESLGLKNLTDMLSYAASRLQRFRRSADVGTEARTPQTTRAQSMEHLYRMTFAISKAYMDRSQSHVYLEAAHEQLDLARKSIQAEKNLCACSAEEYSVRLLKLSELEDRLHLMQTRDDSQ